MTNRVLVAGGGASGLAAAICAAGNGAEVTILEHKDKVGKKILMTGNGRCNLTNMSDVRGKYYSSDEASLDRIYDALARFDAARTRAFFREIGLYTKEKRDGGVYPVSEQASVVLDVLRSACTRLGVQIRTDCEITAVKPDKVTAMGSAAQHQAGGTVSVTQYIRADKEQGKRDKANGILAEKKETVRYDRLILATGGKAAAVSGSDGSGYALAKRLGHSIIEPLPALVQLKCEGTFFKVLSGVRAQAVIRLLVDGEEAACEEGELQLTDYGISGIPVFQLSRLASRALYDGKRCDAVIDFIPYLEKAGRKSWGRDRDREAFIADKVYGIDIKEFSYKTVEEFLSGLVHKKVAVAVCKLNGIGANVTVGQAGTGKVSDCIRMLAGFRVKITAPNSFENAQVCCGGVPLGEVDENFASRKCRGLYIIGELLDCDGICGGYNLQWAWATGAIAGAHAALRGQ